MAKKPLPMKGVVDLFKTRTGKIALGLIAFAVIIVAVAVLSSKAGYARAEAKATDSAVELYSVSGRGEEIMNDQTVGMTSRTKYLVMIDRDLWTWRVYERLDGKWTSIRSGICAIGQNVEKGEFMVSYVFDSFEFGGSTYSNSVWMSEKRMCLCSWDGTEDMFTAAIAMKAEDAKWVRENCMVGTKVVVFGSMI